MKKYHVYAMGNALVDMEFEVTDEFLAQRNIGKGVMTLVDEKRQIQLLAYLDHHKGRWASGGSAANTIIALSHFGGDAYYSCKVADDESGKFYVGDLKAAGVDTNLDAGLFDGITGKCLVMITPDAERTMNTFLGVSEEMSVDELSEQAIEDSEYVYLEGYSVTSPSARQAAIRAHTIARANGVKTAMTFSDPSMVNFFRDGLAEMLGDGVDLLFCNETEALGWTGAETIDQAVEELEGIARSFVITRGADGALVHDGATISKIAPNIVKAIDTNGAGDMFAGAFLYGITHGHCFADAGKIASLASARVVSQFGPRLPAAAHRAILEEVTG
ncbi:MAG: adenosine kinase [Gammaproteobacteria bacterium]